MSEKVYKKLFSALKALNRDIPEQELTKVKNIFIETDIKKGEFFVKAGEVPKYIAYNVSGLFRYYYINSKGVEYTKHFCVENNFVLSYSAMLLGQESKFFIESMEDAKVLVCQFALWEQLLDDHVCWQIVARAMMEKVYIMKEKRESRLLLDNAKIRYVKFLQDYPMLIGRVKQYHIASYLGITPVTLSRIHSKLDFH